MNKHKSVQGAFAAGRNAQLTDFKVPDSSSPFAF